MARALITMTALDTRIEQRLLEYGSLKDFVVALWRIDPDLSGCNWNARIEPVQEKYLTDAGWWQVIPEMRARFNVLED